MAEGMLGGMLGGEEEKPEVEAAEPLAGAEAFAAAVAAKLAGGDPGVARKTEIFLDKQAQILETQNQYLKEEHAARLHFLQGQAREVDLRRFGLRLRVGFQVFIVLVATVIGVGIAVMIHDAVTSRRVVMEPFHAPPGLAARGIDGVVVASGLLDELSHLQDATRSTFAARVLSGAWTGNIKLDVPETGVSLGEISHLLRERFGHDMHIDGDLVETAKGDLALTVRGNGVPAKTFGGLATDLETLTIQAAEYIYSKSQPARWASYLTNAGRDQEALAFCPSAIPGADPQERPGLLNTWGLAIQNTGGSTRESLALFRTAIKLQPDTWAAHNNIMNSLMMLGDEEGAWKAGEELRKAAGGRPGRVPEAFYQNWDNLTWNLGAWFDAIAADAETNAGAGANATSEGPVIADVQLRLHDSEAAELAIKTTKDDPHDPTIGAMTHFVRGRIAALAGDTPRAATEMETFGTAYGNPVVLANYPGYHCWIAPVEEAAGHPDRADALLKTAGTFLDCYRFRADILDGRRDWSGAQEWYAKSVQLAPDLPAGYYSWGVSLAKHEDLVGAITKLKDANQRGPHWADPLKAWGDVLVKQGKVKVALEKYDEALKYAPNWKELKEARESAKEKT